MTTAISTDVWNPCTECLDPLADKLEAWVDPVLQNSPEPFVDEPPSDHRWMSCNDLYCVFDSCHTSRCSMWMKLNLSLEVSQQFDEALADLTGSLHRIEEMLEIHDPYTMGDVAASNYMRVVGKAKSAVTFLRDLSATIQYRFHRNVHAPHGQKGTAASDERVNGLPIEPRRKVTRGEAGAQVLNILLRSPKQSAKEVAGEIGCSASTVKNTNAWKSNQDRLKQAQRERVDPLAIPLADNISGAGPIGTHLRVQREQVEALDEAIDRTDPATNQEIQTYIDRHPEATPQETAKNVGCTAGDVERRQAELETLASQQQQDDQESHNPQKPDWTSRP